MSHFAKIENNRVVQVIVAEQEFVDSQPGEWIQTSYNTRGGEHPEGIPLRKNYAGIDYIYDREKDAFIEPQPFSSWILNEETCLWEPPVPMPEDDQLYFWNEDEKNWTLTVT